MADAPSEPLGPSPSGRRAFAQLSRYRYFTVAGHCEMRRFGLFRFSVFLLLLTAAYIAWPIYTVLTIREAMRNGDTATLASKVEWHSVRASLKASMSAEALAALETEPGAPRPTLWQRVKSTVAPSMAGSVIDRYATPE